MPAAEKLPVASQRLVGRILPANSDAEILILPRTPDIEPVWQRLERARFQLQGTICYCSALEQCWQLDLAQTPAEPVAVAGCSAPAASR